MSVRWRADGTLVCGAKSEPREDDTYIDDRLHYILAVELRVLVPDEDEAQTGLWHWRRTHHALRGRLTRARIICRGRPE